MIKTLLVRQRTAVAFAGGLVIGAVTVIWITDPGRIETIKMGDKRVVIVDHERGTIRTCSLDLGMRCGDAKNMVTGETIYEKFEDRLMVANSRVKALEKELEQMRKRLPDLSSYGTPLHP